MQSIVTENILGYQVAAAKKDACVKQIISWIESGDKTRYFVCANPHSLIISEIDKKFQKTILSADMVTADGIGIVLASKILGGKIRERITGSDIFLDLSKNLNIKGNARYFFLGSTEENLRKIKDKFVTDFPNIKIAGTYSPPFKPEFSEEDNRLMVEKINLAKPDVLWVGMTAPKQEKWIYKNKDNLDVKFIGAIGAVFDFYAGKVKRSHPAFQKMGLEWLPRLLQEPQRLWRRNFVSNPKFMLHVMIHRVKYGKTASKPIGWTGWPGR